MSNNPFTSQTFVETWSKHFNNSNVGFTFKFINNVSFYKKKYLPYYVNIGDKLTNGISYSLSNNHYRDYVGKVFLIRDIPSYFNLNTINVKSKLKLKKIVQYKGYTTKIGEYDSLEHYMSTIFKSNSRSKFRRNIKRLEASFDVDYIMFFGSIQKIEFDLIFKEFYKLLEKRYLFKQESCGELNPKLWAYYCELAFKMIHERAASLFVIYSNKKPIGITFSYHFDKILVEALTVFDIDYYRYNIGHTTIMKMLDWSFKNGIEIFDYTQGDFEYKKRWSSSEYSTCFHLLYDSQSIKSKFLVNFIIIYYNVKRKLRDKKLTSSYRNFMHRLTSLFKKTPGKNEAYNVKIIHDEIPDINSLTVINIHSKIFASQRKAIYDFLYMNPEPAKAIKVYTLDGLNNVYYAFGELNTLKIIKDEV